MAKHILQEGRLFKNVKEHIKEIYPQIRNVDIKVKKDSPGTFKSIIKIKTAKKYLVAIKSDQSIQRSLQRAQEAIIKQVDKVRSKNTRTWHNRLSLQKVLAV